MVVRNYMLTIIRNYLSSERGINPVDVDLEEVIEKYENDSLPKYRIKETEITSYENGKEIKSVVCGLIDRNTGYEYNSNVIEISK